MEKGGVKSVGLLSSKLARRYSGSKLRAVHDACGMDYHDACGMEPHRGTRNGPFKPYFF